MDVDVGILALGLAWIVLFAVALMWGRSTNRGANIVTWLALTFVTWCLEAIVAFVAVNLAFFVFGRPVAIVAAIATIVIMALTPVAWAYGLRHWAKYRAAQT